MEMAQLQTQSSRPCFALWVPSPCPAAANQLGEESSPAAVKKMLSMLPSPLEFPAFVTHISNLTSQLSSREELHTAFACFDDNDTGLLDFRDLKTELMTTGSMRMTEEQVDMALGGFVERTGKMKGKVMYEKFLDSMVGEQPLAQV